MAERVRVSLAGELGLEIGGNVEIASAALGPLGTLALAFLVTERHRPVTRHELAELLWGEDLPPTWEPSLRSVISRVRRRLETAGLKTDTISGGGGCYRLRLPADVVVDIEEAAASLGAATEALGGGQWERARRLANDAATIAGRGFLPGVPGLWVERRQGELEEVEVRAREVLSEAASGAGDHPAAITAAEAVVATQPVRESGYVRLMAAHAAAGNRGGALRAYERCRHALAEELGVSPSEQTEAAYLGILAGEDNAGVATGIRAAAATNLGAELSSFVGRADQIAEIEKLLGGSRLLTLVGPGGVGKTRLATRVGAAAVERHPDGVWLVELAPLGDPVLLAGSVLSALGLAEQGTSTPLQSLRTGLEGRQLLLILDNCEHLAAACAGLVKDLLGGSPGLRVLATSRNPLGMPGEVLWPVPPLTLPDEGSEAPEQLAESEAARLFAERASEADPTFSMTHDNAPDVAETCRRLDGLPLAIELAAARVRSLTVTEIAARLRDRFPVLVGRDPTAPDRHHTLRAAVDWSYEALPAGEQALFRRLSVFAGGFGLEAAEAVCGGSPDDLDVLEGISALVDKSLIVADRARSVTRYRLLETLRHYGAEQLAAAGEERAVRGRHLRWVCDLAEGAEPNLEGQEQAVWLQVVATDEDNVRAALDWAAAHPEGDAGLRAAAALWRYWQVRSRFHEGRRWLRTLLTATPNAAPDLRAKALTSAAILLLTETEHSYLSPENAEVARSLYEESLAIRREIGDRRGAAAALHGLGSVYVRRRDPERAQAAFEDALAIGRELGETRLAAASLTNLAIVAWQFPATPDVAPLFEDARSRFEEALALWRDLGDHYATARALTDLSAIARARGDHAVARACLEETTAIQRRIGDRRGLALTISGLARIATEEADRGAARSLLEECMDICREIGSPFEEARTLIRLGDLAWTDGRLADARRLFQEAAAIGRTIDLKLPLYDAVDSLARMALVQDDISTARRLWHEAEALAREAHDLHGESPWWFTGLALLALAEGNDADAAEHCRAALAHCVAPRWRRPPPPALDVIAVLAVDSGPVDQFAMLVGAADSIRDPVTEARLRVRPEFQRALALVKARLGVDGYESAHAAGAAMSLDEVMALARSSLE